MEKEKNKVKHSETNTTLRMNASVSQYRCSFFCNRTTDNGVISPENSQKEKENRIPSKPK